MAKGAYYTFDARQGDAFTPEITVLDASRGAVSLHDYSVEFGFAAGPGSSQKWRYTSNTADPYITIDEDDGKIYFAIPPAETQTWPAQNLLYEITITPPTGMSETILYGRLRVEANLVSSDVPASGGGGGGGGGDGDGGSGGGSGGNVVGPAISVDGNLVAFNGSSGKLIKDSGLSANAVVTTAGGKTFTGAMAFNGTARFNTGHLLANDVAVQGILSDISANRDLIKLAADDKVEVGNVFQPLNLNSFADPTVTIGDETYTLWHSGNVQEVIVIALTDEDDEIAVDTGLVQFRVPFAMELTQVRASCNTAPTGSGITVDINVNNSTILSTKLTIDAGETTSTTAATPAVIANPSIADDSLISFDVDAVGSGTPGEGLKVTLIGRRV